MANKIQLTLSVDDKGSATIDKFSSTATSRLQQMCEKSQRRVLGLAGTMQQKLGGAIRNIGSAMTSLKTLAVTALAGWGLTELAGGFLDVGSKMDNLRISLDTITKGQGNEWFEKLNEWALKMPVNTEKAIGTFTQLRAMGLKPTIADMTTLVDTASALGGGTEVMEGIARALGQIQTKGKVSAEELLQLAERGVPAYEILKDKLGLTAEQVASIGNAGIDAGTAVKALIEGMADRFGGQAEKMQHKFSNLVMTIKSYWTDFRRLVMDSGVMAYIEGGLKRIVERLDTMRASGELADLAEKTGRRVIETIQKVALGAARAYDAVSEYGPKIWSQISGMWDGYRSLPGWVQEAGLIGAFVGGKKGAVVLAGAAKLIQAVKNQAAGLGLVASGQLDFSEFAGMNATELNKYVKDFNARNPVAGSLNVPLGLSLNAGGMEAKVQGIFSDLANSWQKTQTEASSRGSAIADDMAETAETVSNKQIDEMIKVAEADKTALESRLSAYESFYTSLQSKIQAATQAEKKHVEELNALYRQQADIRKSTESMVMSLKQSTMSGRELYESQKSGLNQQYYDAMRLSGQEQIKALEEYKQAVASFASSYKGGVTETTMRFGEEITRTVIDSGTIVREAISNIEMAANAQQAALAGLSEEKERQIKQDQAWSETLQSTAREAAGEIEYLKSVIAGLSEQIANMQSVVNIEADDRVSPVVDQIQRELDSLHDKYITITTFHKNVYLPPGISAGETAAATAVLGSYARGTDYVPKTGIYELHEGERVITREINREIINRANGIASIAAGERSPDVVQPVEIDQSDWARNTTQSTYINTANRAVNTTISNDARRIISTVLGSYARGTDYVPKTGIYELHEGERVITREINREIINRANG
ncbi:MAG: tape measure protein, partial [Candidatus Paceibacterota bacterium]